MFLFFIFWTIVNASDHFHFLEPKKKMKTQDSGVKISRVRFEEIRGSSSSAVAINLVCSSSNPCLGITLRDIKLSYLKGSATSSCINAAGTASGFVIPRSCLST